MSVVELYVKHVHFLFSITNADSKEYSTVVNSYKVPWLHLDKAQIPQSIMISLHGF